jgi:hypothetical protein
MTNEKVIRQLSTGRKVPMGRIDFRLWAAFGRVPEYLLRTMLSAQSGGVPTEADDAETPADAVENLNFARTVFEESVDPLKVVPGGTAPDEIDPLKLDFDKDILGTLRWQMEGAPGVPVATADGKGTSVPALSTFRKGGGSKKPARSRKDVRSVRRKAE